MTITDFLLARIAEDEELAKLAAFGWGGAWKSVADHEDEWYTIRAEGKREVVGGEDSDVIVHISRHDPARILAECAAKRGIIEDWEDPSGPGVWEGYDAGSVLATDKAVRALAAVYKDHPDYRQEWARG